jgi:hypothetical protein
MCFVRAIDSIELATLTALELSQKIGVFLHNESEDGVLFTFQRFGTFYMRSP